MLYGGGATTAFVLDMMIRNASDSSVSLDDLMRYLYQHYGKRRLLLEQKHILEGLQQITGDSYQDFFRRYINGGETLPLLEVCSNAGISVAFYQGEFYLKPSGDTGALIWKLINGVGGID